MTTNISKIKYLITSCKSNIMRYLSIAMIFVFVFFNVISTISTTYAQTPNSSNPTNPTTPPSPKTFCNDIEFSDGFGTKLAGCYIVYAILKYQLEVTSIFTRLTGFTLDWAVKGYILDIKTLFLEKGESGQDKAWLYTSWSVIRDVANIITFFSAMYLGVRYILGSEQLDFRKSMIKILLYAIFVNFSFPIAKFAIDISNFVSLSIAGNITGFVSGNSISNQIMTYTGVSTVINGLANPDQAFAGFTTAASMALAIVFLSNAFLVFLYATIMILFRALILLVCVIFSPLMFMSTSFKFMEDMNKKWRDNFIGQLLFGPILMLGLWMSINFLAQATSTATLLGSAGNIATAKSGEDVNATGLMFLAIMSLWLTVYGANKVCTGLGGALGGLAGKAVANLGLAAATGGSGLAIRATAGRLGAAVAGSNWVKNKTQNGGLIGKGVGNMVGNFGNKLANAKITIAGKSSVSTNEKLKENKQALNEKHNEFLENNADKIKQTRMGDKLRQARGDEEKMKIAQAMHKNRLEAGDDKGKWKEEAVIKKELGILTKEEAKADTAARNKILSDIKADLQSNRVSNKNADAYLNAKEADRKVNFTRWEENANAKEADRKVNFTRWEEYNSKKKEMDKKIEEVKAQKKANEEELAKKEKNLEELKAEMKNALGSVGKNMVQKDIDIASAKLASLKVKASDLEKEIAGHTSNAQPDFVPVNTTPDFVPINTAKQFRDTSLGAKASANAEKLFKFRSQKTDPNAQGGLNDASGAGQV